MGERGAVLDETALVARGAVEEVPRTGLEPLPSRPGDLTKGDELLRRPPDIEAVGGRGDVDVGHDPRFVKQGSAYSLNGWQTPGTEMVTANKSGDADRPPTARTRVPALLPGAHEH